MELVWTAICRELHAGKLRALVFINEQGQRRNVQLEDLGDFFSKHYVSNLLYTGNGNVQGIGISLNNLDTYNLVKSGSYNYKAGLGETNIFSLAAPYIQNQKIKMREDKANGRLKTEKQKDDNEDKGLTSAQKVAVATAVVGVTVAGANKIGKVISNQLNSKKYADIKQETYDKLNKYQELIEELIRTKNETNRNIQSNKNILSYSRDLECHSVVKPALRKDIMQYGVLGYLNNITTLIQVCTDNVQTYNLFDAELDDIGVTGTLRNYYNMINKRILVVRQLHNKTQQLINNNIAVKNNEIQAEKYMAQLAREQQSLISGIELAISNIEAKIVSVDALGNPKSSIAELDSLDINNVRDAIDRLTDSDRRDEYHDYIYSLESTINENKHRYMTSYNSAIESLKLDIGRQLRNISLDISDLKDGKFTGEEAQNKISGTRQAIDKIEIQLQTSDQSICDTFLDSFKSIKNNFDTSEKQIKSAIDRAEQAKADVAQLESYKKKVNNLIARLTDVDTNDILTSNQKELKQLQWDYSSVFRRIKASNNIRLIDQIEGIDERYTIALNNAKSRVEDNQKIKEEAFKRVMQSLEKDIKRLDEFEIPDLLTQADITRFVLNTEYVHEVSVENGFSKSQVNEVNLSLSKLNREFKWVKDSMRRKLDKIQREEKEKQQKKRKLLETIDKELSKIQFSIETINDRTAKYTIDNISNKLTNFLDKYDLSLIDNVDVIQSHIKELLNKLNEKKGII